MDLRRMLKVYNYVNDEKRPKVNLKFAVGVFALLLTAGALVTFFLIEDGRQQAPPAARARTDYVGLSTDEIQAGSLDAALVEQRWSTWRSEHPDAVIEKREDVRVGSVLVGYRVTYTDG